MSIIKTTAKVVVLGAAVAATAEVLRRTGVVQKVADKVQDLVSQALVAGFAEDETPDVPGEFAPLSQVRDGMYR